MVERRIISQLFETIAFDLVGHVPKGKDGARFILTAICMATRWPDAIALRSITAKCVAVVIVEIFGRMGLPYQVLTDRGTQFTGALTEQLYSMLGINHIMLYEGWRGQTGDGLNVVDWVEELGERLEAVRDIAVKNGLLECSKRKQYYDKGSAAVVIVCCAELLVWLRS